MQHHSILRRHGAVLQALALLAAVVLIFWAVNTPAVVGVSASKRELPVYCVQQDEKLVALSFDAAWGNEDTQTLIDILNDHGVNTTFFVVGDWVDRYPDSVRALSEAGNEVMNHSSSHAHFSSLTDREITADISACNDKIEAVTGVRPTLFRCPYGEYDDHVIRAVNALGMTAVQWDVEQRATSETPSKFNGLRDLRRAFPPAVRKPFFCFRFTRRTGPGTPSARRRAAYCR